MTTNEVFLRQQEAWEFVRQIPDRKDRLLLELMLAHAISFLVSDPEYRVRLTTAPLDLVTFARGSHAFLQKKEILHRVLAGELTSIEQLSPFETLPALDVEERK